MFDADGRPLHVTWNYDRAEMKADAVVHAVGIALGLGGAVGLMILSAGTLDAASTAAVAVYACGLVALLASSAAYNLCPISPLKWRLRRLDHAMIFVLIAATYTPFLSRLPATPAGIALSAGVWAVALAGAGAKILLPGRFDRLSIAVCLALGASGALAWDTVSAALPASTLWLIASGCLVYAAGVVFHLWESLRFQNAVWHGFVLVASALFYGAVLDGVVLA